MNYGLYQEKIQTAFKFSSVGDKEASKDLYLDAIELAEDDREKLEPLFALGLEFKEESPEDAITYFNKCVEIAKKFENTFYYSYLYNAHLHLGDIYVNKKNFPKALFHSKKAYEEIMKMDDDPEATEYLKSIISVIEKKSA